MRIIYKKIMMILLVFVSVIGLAACQSSDANLTDVKNALEIGLNENSSLNEVTTNLTLPTTVEGFEDVVITWESSNEEVITITGVVTQLEDDTNILLTAIITLDALTDEKEFSVTVLGLELDEEDPDED